MTKPQVLRIGIAPRDVVREITLEIARGERRPAPQEPRVWFSSMESLAKILSEKNMLLLETIRNARPRSLMELAELSGRAKSNLSRTLRTMERIGLVEMRGEDRRKVPVVPYDQLRLDLSLTAGQGSRPTA